MQAPHHRRHVGYRQLLEAFLYALPFLVWVVSTSRWLTFVSFLGVSGLVIGVERFASIASRPPPESDTHQRGSWRGRVLELILLVIAASVWLSGAPLVVCWITFVGVIAVSLLGSRRAGRPEVATVAGTGSAPQAGQDHPGGQP